MVPLEIVGGAQGREVPGDDLGSFATPPAPSRRDKAAMVSVPKFMRRARAGSPPGGRNWQHQPIRNGAGANMG